MMPNMFCPECGRPIESSDKFCSSCGTPIDWPSQQPSPGSSPPEPEPSKGNSITCSACGYTNPPGADTCASCGAVLHTHRRPKLPQAPPRKTKQTSPSALAFFQSWKFTLIAAALLIGAVVYFSQSDKNNPHAGAKLSPGEENAIQ